MTYFQRNKMLQRLKDYSQNLEKLIESKLNPGLDNFVKLKFSVEESTQKLDESKMYTDVLNNMLDRDKKNILYRNKPLEKLKKNLLIIEQSTASMKKKINYLQNEQRNYENENDQVMNTFTDKNKYFTNAYEGYLKEFKRITLANSVQLYMYDIGKKHKEDEKKKALEAMKAKNELRQLKLEQDHSLLQTKMERLRNQQNQLAKIQSRCNVKGIHDLIDYFNYLVDTNENLE